ncbi:IS630 family transposase [Cohnella fermenti]|uniref:IS630 family transposase n=1 Tax=Cohnella fermenti TaxID=2565925 RepID=A0A4S4BEU0_9BACL|nr:IS630 family transposase [Cohnella fermenti]THF72373.1 IS630 family transposase [Cohnella fermenti]
MKKRQVIGMERIHLTTKQRKSVKKMMLGQKTEYRLKLRATIIWGLAMENKSQAEVANETGVSTKTVRKWQRRFIDHGICGLEDAPRSGAPVTFDAVERCEVIAIACDKPEHYGLSGQTFWTYDTLTEVVHAQVKGPIMSRTTIWRTLDEHELKPHRHAMWLHSKDPLFKEKVNDIVGLYHTELPDDVILCCVDEKSGMQANEKIYETQLPQVRKAGRVEFEYIRHGTQTLISSFDVKTGHVLATCGDGRKAEDLLAFMERVAQTYREYRKIIIIWDNLNIHHEGPTEHWAAFNAKHGNKFEFHFTPVHASWVNQIEIFYSILTKRILRNGSFNSKDELKSKVMAFIYRWNQIEAHPFRWTFRGYPTQDQEAT